MVSVGYAVTGLLVGPEVLLLGTPQSSTLSTYMVTTSGFWALALGPTIAL